MQTTSVAPLPIRPQGKALFGLAPAPFVEGDFVAAVRGADGRWTVVQPAADGFPNAWQRRVQSGNWAAWKADALWLTPYFSVGVWLSIAMVCVPGAS